MHSAGSRSRKNPVQSVPSAIQPVGSAMEVLDCRVCRAPNGAFREGCFKCGSLLQLSQEVPPPEMERVLVGGVGVPGRVVYEVRQTTGETRPVGLSCPDSTAHGRFLAWE
jgi:hypothetical protein